MSWKKLRLPLLSCLAVLSITAAFLDYKGLLFKDKVNQTTPKLAEKLEDTTERVNPIVSPTATLMANTKFTAKPKATAILTPTTDTNTSTNNIQDSSNNSNNTGGSQISNQTTSPTIAATQKPAIATTAPTTVPTAAPTQEPANIQVWVRGWWYTESGRQYSADGTIKIFNGSTEVASGFYNSYEDPYKATNLPTNANLSVYFYMSGCGQVRNVTTGSNSSLQQLDFHFHSTTPCI